MKIKIRQDPASATSKNYKLKFPTFETGKLEEILHMMKDFKTTTDGTYITYANRKSPFYVLFYVGRL